MKKVSKILFLLIALAVISCILVLSSSAADEAPVAGTTGNVCQIIDKDGNVVQEYNNPMTALKTATDGQTVKMTADFVDTKFSSCGTKTGNITFDLNGHSIRLQFNATRKSDGSVNTLYQNISVPGGSHLTVTGGGTVYSPVSSFIVSNGGTLTIDGTNGDISIVAIRGFNDTVDANGVYVSSGANGAMLKIGTNGSGVLNIYGNVNISSESSGATIRAIGLRYGAVANIGKEDVKTNFTATLLSSTHYFLSHDIWKSSGTEYAANGPAFNIVNANLVQNGGGSFYDTTYLSLDAPATAYGVLNVADSTIKATTAGSHPFNLSRKAVITMTDVDMDLSSDQIVMYFNSPSEMTLNKVDCKITTTNNEAIRFASGAKAKFVATNNSTFEMSSKNSYFSLLANSFSKVSISDSILNGTTSAMFKTGSDAIPTSFVELDNVDMNLTSGNFFFQPPTVKATNTRMTNSGYMVNLAYPWIYLDSINPLTYAGWETSNKDLYDLVTEVGGYGLLIGAGCSHTTTHTDASLLATAPQGTAGAYLDRANAFSVARGVTLQRGSYDQRLHKFVGTDGKTVNFLDYSIAIYNHESATPGTEYKEHNANPSIGGASYIISPARDGWYTVKKADDGSNIYVTYKYNDVASTSAPYFTAYPSSAAALRNYTETVEKEDGSTEEVTKYYLNPVSVPLNSQSFYVFEADIMTPTGEYTEQTTASSILNMGYQIRAYYVGVDSKGNTASTYNSVAPSLVMNKTVNGYTIYIRGEKTGKEVAFDSTPGKWHHLGFVIAMDNTVNEDGSYNVSKSDLLLFVDGELKYTLEDAVFPASWDQKSFHNNGGGLDYTCVYETRFNFPIGTGTSNKDNSTKAEMAFDNYTISKYPASYNPGPADADAADTVAALMKANTYDPELYGALYGNTEVVVDGNYFDNLEAGLATSKENSVVELYTDLLDYVPKFALTVDTNGYAFSYSSDRFTAEVNEGVYTFTEAETVYTVNWYNKDGEVFKTESYTYGSTIYAPEYNETVKTGWFKYSYNGLWTNAEGSTEPVEISTASGDANYYPVIDIDSVEAYLSLASYSLGLRGHITLYLLVPSQVPENVSGLAISDVTETKPARQGIDYGGRLYNEYKVQYVGVQSLASNYTPDLDYTVTLPDGRTKTVRQTFTISPLSYMQYVLAESKLPQEEQRFADAYTLVADLLQYTVTLYAASGMNGAKFIALYNEYKHLATDLSALEVDEMSEEEISATIGSLADYCQSISYTAHTYEPSFNFIFKSPAQTNGGVKDVVLKFNGYIPDRVTYNYGPLECNNNANYYCYYYASSTVEAYNYAYAIDAKNTAVYQIVDDGNGGKALGGAVKDEAITSTLTKTEYLFMTQSQNLEAHNFNEDFVVHFVLAGNTDGKTEVTGNYNLTTYYNGISVNAENAKYLDFTKAVMAYSKSAVAYRYPDGKVLQK